MSNRFIAKPAFHLSLLTLAMLQVSQAFATPNDQIALDGNNVAHVVVSDSYNDPSTATASASSVSQKALNFGKSQSSDTTTLLGNVTGMNAQTAGGISALPVFQGMADHRLKILVDGVDSIASCPNNMNSPLSYAPPTAIEKLKVYTGVTPASVSGNSVGATIVVETARPKFAKPRQNAVLQNQDLQNSVLQNNEQFSDTTIILDDDKTAQQIDTVILDNANTEPKRFHIGKQTLETSGEIGAFYRSNGNQHGANVSLSTTSENVSLTYKANYAKSDNYKAGGDFKNYTETGNVGQQLDKDEVGSTAFENMNQSLDLAYLTGNHLWQFGYNWQNVPNELYPNQRMDMLDNRLNRYNLRYTGELDFGTLEAQAYHENVKHGMDFGSDKRYWYGMQSMVMGTNGFIGKPCPSISGTCAFGMPMLTESKTNGLNIKLSRELNDTTNIRTGVEYQDYTLDDYWPVSGSMMYPNVFVNINNGKREKVSVFGEWEKAISPTWTSQIGVRYENLKTNADKVQGYNNDATSTVAMVKQQVRDSNHFNAQDLSKTDHNWNASIINRFALNPQSSLELGLSHQERSPSLYERYTWSTSPMMATMNNTAGDGNGYVGDVNLKPESANKIALTFNYQAKDDKYGVTLTPYFSQIDNYIDAVQINPMNGQAKSNEAGKYNVLRYTNQDARIYGVDVSARAKLGENRLGAFGITGSLNYTKGTNTQTDSPLYNIMPLNGKVALTHEKNGWNNKLEWVGVTAKDDVSVPRNEIKTAGYGLLNLSSGYDFNDNLNVTVGIDNVLDKKYALPLGGAYMGQGRTMSMNGELGNGLSNYGTPVYGAGRSVFASVNYKF